MAQRLSSWKDFILHLCKSRNMTIFNFILSYFTDMRTIADLWHSYAIQKNFQGWPLIYRAQSLFKAVMYLRAFWMALSYHRNVIFPLQSLLAFETNPQGHFIGIFSSRFFFHLANFRFRSTSPWIIRAVLFSTELICSLAVIDNSTQHGLSDNKSSNKFLITNFVLIVARVYPTIVPTSITNNAAQRCKYIFYLHYTNQP